MYLRSNEKYIKQSQYIQEIKALNQQLLCVIFPSHHLINKCLLNQDVLADLDEYKLKNRKYDESNSRVEVFENERGDKMIKKTIKDMTKYTIRETKIAGELYQSQENIVAFYHIEIDQNRQKAYIYMEYCEKDLSQYQKEIQNSKDEKEKMDIIVNIAVHIVQGYQFLIKKFPSFMHRDIKPQNIFLKNDIWKIGDFGCSKIERDILQTGVIGTQYYLAPEVIKGQYDNKCDVYSLGILMYQFVYGSLKLDLKKIKNANFRKLIEILTSKDPSQRPDWFQIGNYFNQYRNQSIYNIQKQHILIPGRDFEMKVLKAQINMSNHDSHIQHYDIQQNIINLNKLFADVVAFLEPDDQILINQQAQICLRAVFQLQIRVYDKNLKKYLKNNKDLVDGLNEQKKLVQWQQIIRLDQYSNQQGQEYDRNVEFYSEEELIRIITKYKDRKDQILQKFIQFIEKELNN
ncbi:hypothetical protein pb186bvf_008301 [Paramecium bursaria]